MRQRGQKNYAPLIAGMNTEASPLQAPEGTSSDELNMVLDTNGMVRKPRYGTGRILQNPVTLDVGETVSVFFDGVLGSYYWSRYNIFIQVLLYSEGSLPNLYRLFEFRDATDLSLVTSFVIPEGIPTYSGDTEPDQSDYDRAFQRALQDGVTISPLNDGVVFTTSSEPVFCTIDDNGPDVWEINPHIRDFELLDSGISNTVRPNALTDEHEYNLNNAGWWYNKYNDSTGAAIADLPGYFNSEDGNFPSNSDIPYLGLRVDSSSGDRYFSAEELNQNDTGNTEAPRGHYVFPIRRIDRQSKIGTGRLNDGTGQHVTLLIEDGVDVGTGNPPTPGNPLPPPPTVCLPGEPCILPD